jgi:hypothetical protein
MNDAFAKFATALSDATEASLNRMAVGFMRKRMLCLKKMFF